MFDFKNLQIDIIKKFDGINNYFNPSFFGGKLFFRKESIYQEKMVVSDIVDINNNLILENKLFGLFFAQGPFC